MLDKRTRAVRFSFAFAASPGDFGLSGWHPAQFVLAQHL
jgi:hypothetical protein